MPENTSRQLSSGVSWNIFLKITVESLIAFYIATFCLAMVVTHRSDYFIFDIVFLVILYAFIIIVCGWRVGRNLSIATVMLIIPIAPFVALAIIVSMIPLLQLFK
ncbi:MAG: hypothetical protein H0W64_00340 [Gammaproteobacteria bacterium]|nr:hypothetical protein [Gammaproteobacteria bacterium]